MTALTRQNKKEINPLISFLPVVICFLILWQFFWFDNSHLRFSPYVFWPVVAFISLVSLLSSNFLKNAKTYLKIIAFSFIWCLISVLFTPSKYDGVLFLAELLLYFFACAFVVNKKIDYIKIVYVLCFLHMVLLLSQRFLPSIFYTFVGLISGPSTVSILQHNANSGIYYGFTGQTSTISFYLIVGLIISLYNITKNKKIDFKYIVLAFIFGLSILLTNRRGALIFSLALILLFLLMDRRKLAIKLVIIAMIVFVVLAIGMNNIPGVKEIINKFEVYNERNDLLSGRTAFWNYCIEMFESKPVFGAGFNSFTNYSDFEVNTAHNSYIQKLGEMGIVGTIVFFLPHLYTFGLSILLYFSRKTDFKTKKYMLLMILFQSFFFMEAVFEGFYETPIFYVFIFLIEMSIISHKQSNVKRMSLNESYSVYSR